MTYIPFKFFPRNRQGKDYVVGDIHGMYSALDALLEQVNFSTEHDRLFALGDLVDRGTESHRAVEYLDYPWFHSIMGNHEVMLLDAARNPEAMKNWVSYNGGNWWPDAPTDVQNALRKKTAELPLAMEIRTVNANIGLVHANLPFNMSWKTFIKGLKNNKDIQDYALWSRERIKRFGMDKYKQTVEDIDWVLVGHTPLEKPKKVGNVYFLDTGAAFYDDPGLSKLSMLEINPRMKLHQISTAECVGV